MRRALPGFLAGLLVAVGASAQDFSKFEVKTVRITDSVYALTGAGGNIGLAVGDDAVFLIDDQFAPMTAKISAAIAKVTSKPVKFLLNTHWHGDHTGGNENFARTGTVIFAHENVRKRMSTEQLIESVGSKVAPSPGGALPVVTFTSAVSFFLNGDEIRAIHVPHAHTDGDVIVHFVGNDVIHMGDVYWNGMYPFIDTGTGGSFEGTIAALDTVLGIATERTKIIAGHGAPVSGKAELQAYRDMMAAILGRVTGEVRRGRKLEEIVAADISADYDEKWGKMYIKGPKFVESIARDLIRRAR